jgi:hypothetical protein
MLAPKLGQNPPEGSWLLYQQIQKPVKINRVHRANTYCFGKTTQRLVGAPLESSSGADDVAAVSIRFLMTDNTSTLTPQLSGRVKASRRGSTFL